MFGIAATQVLGSVEFPVTMRTRPTALEQSGTATDYVVLRAGVSTSAVCSAVPAYNIAGITNASLLFTVASGLSNGSAGAVYAANTSAYLGFFAEL